MQIAVITLFPEMFDALHFGIVGRAIQEKKLELILHYLRDYTDDPNQRVDDRPYGGGPGMVMQYEPLANAVKACKADMPQKTPVIHLSPQGKPVDQPALTKLSTINSLILICGRYEGVDERFIEAFIDAEWSVGDYVLSGGELPAMLLIDGLTRLLPGALGHEASASQDSFSNGLLDYPHYTRPEVIHHKKVPNVLLSGDHAAIQRWRHQQSLGKTWQKRPDLLKRRVLSTDEQQLLDEYIKDNAQPNEE